MTEQATEHPDLDQLQDASPGLGDRLRGAAERFMPRLPEDSWAAPKERPAADPLDESATTTSDRSDRADDLLYDPSAGAGSTGSTDLASFRKGTARVYGELVAGVAALLAGLANWRAKEAEDDPLWLMSEEEAHGIGDPLGRIAARRATLPISGDEGTDIMDGLQAGIAAISYLGRNMMMRADRKRPQAAPIPNQDAA